MNLPVEGDVRACGGAVPKANRQDTSTKVIPKVQEKKELKKEKQQLKEELTVMQQKLKIAVLTSTSLDEDKIRLYTGLPSLMAFTWISNLICGCLEPFACISKCDQLLLTLVKLRLGLTTPDLACRFNISSNTVSSILVDALPKMAHRLKFLINWPCKEELMRNVPKLFKPKYKNCCVIVDCFEFLIEKPLNLTAGGQTWSNGKHQHTIKCLLGITPYGSVSYVSQCWGGRISDTDLVLQSGFLNNIYFGDMVMTRRDFLIDSELSAIGARLAIPKLKHECKHLHGQQFSDNQELSSLCSYIEKAFKQIKMHRILSHTLPISLLPYVDEIITCCSALSNLQSKFVV